jgi:uncharacterized protein
MIFVDSSAWVAISDVRDANHQRAIAFHATLVQGKEGRLITSDFVLDETFTLLRKRSGGDVVRSFAKGLEASPSVQRIRVTQAHYQEALDLFLAQGKRSWSFTDCTSFAIMRELGIRKGFTFDRDFREAGFEIRPS